jgi:hypothetical protein
MSQWLTSVWLRAKALFKRRELDRDLEDELRFHLAMREEKMRAAGLDPVEAGRASRRRFGNRWALQETCREMWTFVWLEDLWQNVRHAFRAMRKNPGFTAVVLVTLALGIGASTAVFSVVDPLLFRRLPYPKDNQLVSVGYLGPVDNNEFNVVSSYFDWQQGPFKSLTAMRPGVGCDVMIGDAPRRAASTVTPWPPTFSGRWASPQFSAGTSIPRTIAPTRPRSVCFPTGSGRGPLGATRRLWARPSLLTTIRCESSASSPKTSKCPSLARST